MKKLLKRIKSQERGFLNFLGSLMKARFPFTKNVLLELEVKVAAPGTNEAFQNNLYRSGMTARIISNEEMKDIMEIVKSVEKSCLLIKSVSKTLENKVKNKG